MRAANPITSLDAGTGFCLHVGHQRPGASEFFRYTCV